MTDTEARALLRECSTTTRRDAAQVALDSLEASTQAHEVRVRQWRRGIAGAVAVLLVWTGANIVATGIVVGMARWVALHR
jgi:branched-subunit amino acid transport protein